MPGEVIDYIAATLGLLLIFMIVTSSFLFMTAPVLNYTAMRDRVTVSSNMIDYLLLSQGVPENWGYGENVSVFGLAQEKAPNYYVDSFKLMRIWNSTENPDFPYLYILGYVDFGWTKQILGITKLNTFQVIFRPALEILILENSTDEAYEAVFNITVRGGSGPVPGASVNATFVYAKANRPQQGQQPPEVMLLQASNVTDVTGFTRLNFTIPKNWGYLKQSYTLVVHASLGGIKGSKYHSSRPADEPLIKIFINGTNISVAHPHINQTGGQQDVRNYNITFAPPFSRTGYSLVDLPEPDPPGSKLIPGQAGLTSAGYLTPGMFCIGVDEAGLAEKNKPPAVYLIPWGISAMGVTVVYGDNPVGQGPVVTVERVVTVGEETYIAILAFWSRESRTVYPTPGTPS